MVHCACARSYYRTPPIRLALNTGNHFSLMQVEKENVLGGSPICQKILLRTFGLFCL